MLVYFELSPKNRCLFACLFFTSVQLNGRLVSFNSVQLNLTDSCQLNQIPGRQEELGFNQDDTIVITCCCQSRREGMCLGSISAFLSNMIITLHSKTSYGAMVFVLMNEKYCPGTICLRYRLVKQEHITVGKCFSLAT